MEEIITNFRNWLLENDYDLPISEIDDELIKEYIDSCDDEKKLIEDIDKSTKITP